MAEAEEGLMVKLSCQIWSAHYCCPFAGGPREMLERPSKVLGEISKNNYQGRVSTRKKEKKVPTLSFTARKLQRPLCRCHGGWRCYPFLRIIRQDGAARRVYRLDMRGSHGHSGYGRDELVTVAR